MNKDLNFEYIEDLVERIITRVENNDELFVTVIGKFTEIQEVIKVIMQIADVDFSKISLSSPDVDGYEDEYLLDCWYDGIIHIGCEPAKRNGKYLNFGDEIYLFDNCSSKILPLCEEADLYIINLEEECDCEESCCDCCECERHKEDNCIEYTKTNDSGLHGFTASRTDDKGYYSYSFYTNDSLSKNDIQSMLKEFGF